MLLYQEVFTQTRFDESQTLSKLRHYLPSQAPLKDFIHHNTLHAFQHLKFEEALRQATAVLGCKTSLSLTEYRALYHEGKISREVLENVVIRREGHGALNAWIDRLLHEPEATGGEPRTGQLRALWRTVYHLDLDTIVHTTLFRILNTYLDQGIALTPFPVSEEGLLESLRLAEERSWVSFFKTPEARELLLAGETRLEPLLELLVGDARYYEQYLFDQQFAHPGWSGMVAVLEDQPHGLMDARRISLRELIWLELLLEVDNLNSQLGNIWHSLHRSVTFEPVDLLAPAPETLHDHLRGLWQEAYEWSFFDQVLAGIQRHAVVPANGQVPGFQAFFCIDDRECSLRRYLEHFDPTCKTYGTPGFFGIDAYYLPNKALFYTKICPAPMSPRHLIKEVVTQREQQDEAHFQKNTHSLFKGWIIAQTLGFWSAIKLMLNIFRPSLSPASAFSFDHMDAHAALTVENRSPQHQHDGLQVGYTLAEMADRVEALLKSTGLVDHFAPLVYVVGHGASSANNTHYAGYDCGACSGRPGSANARAFCQMANDAQVRALLAARGLVIPATTEFLGGLHDTTRDEVMFYDEEFLSPLNASRHAQHLTAFRKALQANARERARRLVSVDMQQSPEAIHEAIKRRSVSLFEPRPELNHATNSLCIIGRRELNGHLFLDRRAFLNSYDYRTDPDGRFLQGIVNAAAPVCGGINLEYYFSRVDNEKLGAGSKLPHNVMGLIGVANGFEGDLRPGLPWQMVEVHDPIRLLMIIEHLPEVVLATIQRSAATYEWFLNEWILLTVVHPETHEIFRFHDGAFESYLPAGTPVAQLAAEEFQQLISATSQNLPIYQMI